jgi:hypothetical protein
VPWSLTLGMREQRSTADARIATIAGRQHGVVTQEQLVAVGLDKSAITRRVQAGRLYRLHRGVYAVGHRSLSWRGRWLAAVLAAGDGAVLSHSSAAALWQFLRPIPGPVHVTVGAAVRRKPRPGLQIHRSRTLSRSDLTRRHDIAVTTPARTIADIRGEVEPYLFRRALRQAELAGFRVPHLSATRRTRSDLHDCPALGFARLFCASQPCDGWRTPGSGAAIGGAGKDADPKAWQRHVEWSRTPPDAARASQRGRASPVAGRN